MTDAEIKALEIQMMLQLNQLENDRDNYKRLAVVYAERNKVLSREIEKIQKLLDVERTVTENILNRLYDNEVSEYL
jgi:hypothetical protein